MKEFEQLLKEFEQLFFFDQKKFPVTLQLKN